MKKASVRKFAYRYPRVSTRLSIDFIAEDTITIGVCESLSEVGMSARFSDEILLGVKGRVTIYYEEVSISLHAVISGRDEDRSTLQFLFSSMEEQAAMHAVIELLRVGPTS